MTARHTPDGLLTDEAQAEYLADVKPVTDLYGTEHDAWKTGEYKPDAVWDAAADQMLANLAARPDDDA